MIHPKFKRTITGAEITTTAFAMMAKIIEMTFENLIKNNIDPDDPSVAVFCETADLMTRQLEKQVNMANCLYMTSPHETVQ